MAPKDPTTPKSKGTKAAKGGVVKRTPVKSSPDLVFLWKCVKMSTGMKIDWAAIAKDAGKPAGTVQKQYSRLNIKMESYLANTASGSADATDENNEKDIQTGELNESE
ncbi:uncharacterized protein N7500_004478 [Penicillium coprophilum]|uniref:uncharacterized protein n=1 Tax=Penicillium coprophilum TaxID=36646 RepID=UPI00238459A7|nr:uncharacterized protein N7500_004478 [Penicillium coprophilum]KAJ5162648.1 hypothetical protein N7500_004478 [Penicillium coprophilum]